jgi:hypothetical protein
MAKIQDIDIPHLEFAEAAAPGTPASGIVRIYAKTDGLLYSKDDAGTETVVTGGGAVGGALAYVRLEDQKTQNTAGGTFTSGAWQTRVLQTEVTDTGGNCTLASNQITLAAGDYECLIIAPASFVDGHQLRLQNVTDATTVILGQNAYSSANETDLITTPAVVRGVFTIAASKALEVQHRCQVTRATNGFGSELNWGTEVYTVVELWRRA